MVLAPPAAPVELRPYTLGVGDVIDVKLFYHPDLNESVQVRPDGKISLQLVGDVTAVGVTVDALGQTLKRLYTEAGLRDPTVAALLRKSAGQKVFVGGEVATPRMVPFEGRLTLTQALFEAGGLKTTAERASIVILSNDGAGGATFRTVDLRQVIDHGTDVVLEPYDVVMVPTSFIAKVNQFVEQYIAKVIPIALTAGFSYVTGATTAVIR